jgi:cyclophilin family peptidyl-prolyl cis-trans isomerase/HEAT repeat protein
MKKIITICFAILICFSIQLVAQISTDVLVQISKAEDELRFDKTLENLMKSPNAKIRTRAALASGRIGNENAVSLLTKLLESDSSVSVRSMSAFALGEIESIKGADAIIKVLQDTKNADAVRTRAVEAAGKIAAANAKDDKAKKLGEAILDALDFEDNRGAKQNREIVLLGITAVLRAKPEGGDAVAGRFLTNTDARIRADAANTLSRLRSKTANEKLRAMLLSDTDAIARANAARALGAAEDPNAFNLLLEAAVSDEDSRVRVSAIRSLGSLKDAKATERLLMRGENLLIDYKKSKFASPIEKNELLEIATTLGRILPNTNDKNAVEFLTKLHSSDNISSETTVALARVAPKMYVENIGGTAENLLDRDWRTSSAVFQGLGEIASLSENEENKAVKSSTRVILVRLIADWMNLNPQVKEKNTARLAVPDMLRAFAAFKSENTSGIFLPMLETERDLFIRAAVADTLGDQPVNKENVEALKTAFTKSLEADKQYNDAQLSILSTLVKLDKREAINSLKAALDAPNFLVRRNAAQLIKQNDLQTDFPNPAEKVGMVKPYNRKNGAKLGVLLNSNADYIRAVSRKSAKAILTTEKGTFTIEFFPEDAPLTVDNFIKLARRKYFNGLVIHRVVPNFVMQDGDPRGDGNGGPGWEIRDEMNEIPYERGMVGMALSGKDTGGSQWFVTHSPQPHLDGGYTVFGRVNETDMKIVDNLVRGDKILSVKIVEGKLPVKKGK